MGLQVDQQAAEADATCMDCKACQVEDDAGEDTRNR